MKMGECLSPNVLNKTELSQTANNNETSRSDGMSTGRVQKNNEKRQRLQWTKNNEEEKSSKFQENDFEEFFEGKVDVNRNLSRYDPEIIYAVCIASKEVAQKKEKKTKKRMSSESFSSVITNLFRRNLNCTEKRETKSTEMIVNHNQQHNILDCSDEPQVINYHKESVTDVEHDLINNCPLVWTEPKGNGRKVSVSERHQNDRLMVASACRKYTQIQYINRKIF